MPQALIAFHLLGEIRRFYDTCAYADNEELCSRVLLSGWGLFVGSIVGVCVFYWLTEHVPRMRKLARASSLAINRLGLDIDSGCCRVLVYGK